MEGNDQILLGEIEGAMCLRLTGDKRKTQVTAVVTQDHKELRRLSLQTFKSRAGDWIQTTDKDEFTFGGDEFTSASRNPGLAAGAYHLSGATSEIDITTL